MVVASRMGSRTSLHDGSLWTWTEGDHSGRADDATVIQATGIALTVGAWVRSPDAGTTIRQFGATPGAIVDGPLASAFGALSRVRTSPDGLNGWGVGRLGVGKGVAQVGKYGLRGLPAWMMHRGYHVLAVPSWERKVRVLAVWLPALVFGRDIVSLQSVQHPRDAFVSGGQPRDARRS